MNQEQNTHWKYFESHMRTMFQQITSEEWSPIIEVSGDERLLLRLFRTLPEKVQDAFLEEIGTKALHSVCPEIEGDEDEVDEELGNEIRRLMPPSYDSFEQAVETFNVSSIIFGSSRNDAEMETDFAAEAEGFNDSGGCDFSPEELEGYIARWREEVVAEIEWRVASKKLDNASLEYKSRERIGSNNAADLLAQALAVVGGEIVVALPFGRLNNKTICRATMSVVEMANDLHTLLRDLESNHRGANVWTMNSEIRDLCRDMQKDPDQSLLKQVEYQKKMIQLMEAMLSGYANFLNQQKMEEELQRALRDRSEVLAAVQKILRDQGKEILAGQYSDRPELLDLNLKTMDDPELRVAILRMFQNHPNKAFSDATQRAMLRVIQDSSRSKQQQDQELILQLQSLMQ